MGNSSHFPRGTILLLSSCRMVRLSYKRTTLYGSHGRFSRSFSFSLSLSLLVYLRIDEIPFTGLSREREPREENRGEVRGGKKGRPGRREGRRRDEMWWL